MLTSSWPRSMDTPPPAPPAPPPTSPPLDCGPGPADDLTDEYHLAQLDTAQLGQSLRARFRVGHRLLAGFHLERRSVFDAEAHTGNVVRSGFHRLAQDRADFREGADLHRQAIADVV